MCESIAKLTNLLNVDNNIELIEQNLNNEGLSLETYLTFSLK